MTTSIQSVDYLGMLLFYMGFDVFGGVVNAWWALPFVLLAILGIWWRVDRAALERRIRRLEARSVIADERRVTASNGLTEVEHKLHEVEGRVVDMESLPGPEDSPATSSTEFSNGWRAARKRAPVSRAS